MKELDLIDAVSEAIGSYLDDTDDTDGIDTEDLAENIVARLKNLGVIQ